MAGTSCPSGLRDWMDPEAPSCLATGKSPTVRSGREFTSEASLLLTLLRRMAIQQPYVLGHGHRTASYALRLGESVGLSSSDLTHLHYAALLHDIGQLTLPAEILNKDGPLTAEEYELVQCHPRAGAELLQPISFLRVPALWIAHHHERWDGSGYPYGCEESSFRWDRGFWRWQTPSTRLQRIRRTAGARVGSQPCALLGQLPAHNWTQNWLKCLLDSRLGVCRGQHDRRASHRLRPSGRARAPAHRAGCLRSSWPPPILLHSA